MGCGTGEPLGKFFIEKDYKLTGVDTSVKMIELSKQQFPQERWLLAEMLLFGYHKELAEGRVCLMIITSIKLATLKIPLIRPFITAARRTEWVEDVVVMLHTDSGLVGYGSAASTPSITGDDLESIISIIKTKLGVQLIGKKISDFNQLLYQNEHAIPKHTSAKAAIDVGLHDLFAQYCGIPLFQFFGSQKSNISTSITVSVKPFAEMVVDALSFVKEGYRTIKIKVGVNAAEDIQRVRAIRHAIDEKITLLVDANQGWKLEEAIRVISAFIKENLNVSLIEQPVKADNIRDLKKISDTVPIPVAADEACFSPFDVLNLAKQNACGVVNIKLMKSGGLENAKVIYCIAAAAGMQVMVGSMLESPISIAAMASFAVSKPAILFADLDSICLIQDNYIQGGARLLNNEIVLSDKPGLGIEGFKDGLTIIGDIR